MTSQPFSVQITRRASKQIQALDRPIQCRVVAAIDLLADHPEPSNSRALVGRPGRRIRVGDYRVIYVVQREQLVVLVIDVGHRRQIYR